VTVLEASRAEVLEEDVRAHVQYQRLGVHADTRDAGQVVNQPFHLVADYAV